MNIREFFFQPVIWNGRLGEMFNAEGWQWYEIFVRWGRGVCQEKEQFFQKYVVGICKDFCPIQYLELEWNKK